MAFPSRYTLLFPLYLRGANLIMIKFIDGILECPVNLLVCSEGVDLICGRLQGRVVAPAVSWISAHKQALHNT